MAKSNTIVFTHYTSGVKTAERLTAAGFTFTRRDVFNNFWGVEFTVQAPRGKGATDKLTVLSKIAEGK